MKKLPLLEKKGRMRILELLLDESIRPERLYSLSKLSKPTAYLAFRELCEKNLIKTTLLREDSLSHKAYTLTPKGRKALKEGGG
jgi:DNA-binding PadR family transcriptional regulator